MMSPDKLIWGQNGLFIDRVGRETKGVTDSQ